MSDYTPKVGDIYAEDASGEGHIIPNYGSVANKAYIPTTEEVSRRYMFGCWQEHEDTSGDYRAEFDRWLAEVKAQEAKAERERIMKLVQKQLEADPYNSVLRALEAGISQMPVKGETE